MSCSCNNKEIDFCHKPKVSDWQLDMVRSMIKCLCNCGDTPVDVPSCVATFLTIMPIDGFPQNITYSKNGGPFREITIFDAEPDGFPSISHMFRDESLTGFAFTLLEGSSEMSMEAEFCGFNTDASVVSNMYPAGFKPPVLLLPEGAYEGPFNVKEEKNTLTFIATNGVPSYTDFFHCMINPTGADALTLESCAVLEVDYDAMPPPILT